MRYESVVYRPPSEAKSLIIQVTLGCSYNGCTFCSMYKDKQFSIRTLEDIESDLEKARLIYKNVNRIFLADGDALIIPMDMLVKILGKIQTLFPECERVGLYASPHAIKNKTLDDLRRLKDLGVGILYLGVESGSDIVLTMINKGSTSTEMIEAGLKVKQSGMKLSTMIISGLGGRDNKEDHAVKSAEVINTINPDYLSLVTLMVEPGTQLFDEVLSGRFKLLSVEEVMDETRLFISRLELENCLFRTNCASNFLAIGGSLPDDKVELLELIENAIKQKIPFRNEANRAL